MIPGSIILSGTMKILLAAGLLSVFAGVATARAYNPSPTTCAEWVEATRELGYPSSGPAIDGEHYLWVCHDLPGGGIMIELPGTH